MNWKNLIRGPFRDSTKRIAGPTSISRIGFSGQYPVIHSVEIDYSRLAINRKYIFPWITNIEFSQWVFQVKVRRVGKSALTFGYDCTVDSADVQRPAEYLDKMIDYVTLQAIRSTLIANGAEPMLLKESAKA